MKHVSTIIILLFVCVAGYAAAQQSIGESIDCTDVSVDYKDNRALTREERLSLMDRALFESLDKFELCQAARAMAQASSSSAAAGGASGTGDATATSGEGSGGANGSVESMASSTMSGTEEVSSQPSAAEMGGLEAVGQDASGAAQGGEKSNGDLTTPTATGSNGKTPDDIPVVANDDALAAQIRYAAETETDPVKKAQLWNEYRKYKGLPQK